MNVEKEVEDRRYREHKQRIVEALHNKRFPLRIIVTKYTSLELLAFIER